MGGGTSAGGRSGRAAALARVWAPDGLAVGVVVAPGGRVLTTLQPLVGARTCQVELADGVRREVAGVLAVDERTDLALLRVTGRGLPFLPLSRAERGAVGSWWLALWPVGPGGGARTQAVRVAAVRTVAPGVGLLVLEAPQGGLPSGAPLLDEAGQVAAVTCGAGLTPGGPALAVPARTLAGLLERVEEAPLEVLPAVGRPPPRPRRVPRHRLEVLEGCSQAVLLRMVATLTHAVRVGAPAYNGGDAAACYRVYVEAARGLLAEVPPGSPVQRTLAQALVRARGLTDADAQAWALRDAIDGLLEVIARKLGGPEGSPPAARRQGGGAGLLN